MFQAGIYRHRNGNLYHAFGVCRHSETLEEMIVYRTLYGNYGLWVRPRAMFEELVVTDGVAAPRFTFVKALDSEAAELR